MYKLIKSVSGTFWHFDHKDTKSFVGKKFELSQGTRLSGSFGFLEAAFGEREAFEFGPTPEELSGSWTEDITKENVIEVGGASDNVVYDERTKVINGRLIPIKFEADTENYFLLWVEDSDGKNERPIILTEEDLMMAEGIASTYEKDLPKKYYKGLVRLMKKKKISEPEVDRLLDELEACEESMIGSIKYKKDLASFKRKVVSKLKEHGWPLRAVRKYQKGLK